MDPCIDCYDVTFNAFASHTLVKADGVEWLLRYSWWPQTCKVQGCDCIDMYSWVSYTKESEWAEYVGVLLDMSLRSLVGRFRQQHFEVPEVLALIG